MIAARRFLIYPRKKVDFIWNYRLYFISLQKIQLLTYLYMKLKTLLLTTLLFPLCISAVDRALVLELNNGQTAYYFLKEKPVLTMEDQQLSIVTSTVQTNYPRSGVKRFYFTEGNTDGILSSQNEKLLFRQTDANNLEISGLSGKESIMLYDMSGHLLGRFYATNDKATISLSGHQKGVYLIKVGKSQTIKFIKK